MSKSNSMDENKSQLRKKAHNIHDNYFRSTMSYPEISREFLANFLDKEVLDRIDLDKINKLPDQYVSEKNQQYFTDALYEISLDNNVRPGLLYVLIEHKSSPAKGVIFQLLEYLALIYKNHFSIHKEKVPVVIPIVVYHGTSKWNIEKEFLKFVDIDLEKDADLLKYIPNFFYRIYDIPRMDISFDNYSNELKAFLLTLMIRNKKKQLPELIKILDKVENDDYFLKTLMYILEQLNNEEVNRFNDIIHEESIKLNEGMKS